MSDSIAMPVVGMAAGAALMLLGSNQLVLAWATDTVPRRDRVKVGMFGGGMLLIGAALEVVSQKEIEERS